MKTTIKKHGSLWQLNMRHDSGCVFMFMGRSWRHAVHLAQLLHKNKVGQAIKQAVTWAVWI